MAKMEIETMLPDVAHDRDGERLGGVVDERDHLRRGETVAANQVLLRVPAEGHAVVASIMEANRVLGIRAHLVGGVESLFVEDEERLI